jgi:hypothetical protein
MPLVSGGKRLFESNYKEWMPPGIRSFDLDEKAAA